MSCIYRPLPSLEEVERSLPLSKEALTSVEKGRAAATQILQRQDPKIALIFGPCSVHSFDEALQYALNVRQLQKKLTHFFLIMRVFVEKPRTHLGWKGMLYDPHLDGSNDLQEGIFRSRKLLIAINELGVPCATEFLDPLAARYIVDLISWGLIGARTTASQPHRQLASGLAMPVGFKNSIHGELGTALSGIASAKMAHAHFSFDKLGRIAAAQTTGNPLAHLVLRGSDKGPNSDPSSVEHALSSLRERHLEERIVIDCAHGNSGKDPEKQKLCFKEGVEQIKNGNKAICALMMESHLVKGKQPIPEEPEQLRYGVSITDPCLGWEETEELISEADASMSFVQK